jgi:hypothetical protein
MVRGLGGPPAQEFESPDGRFSLGPLSAGNHRLWAVAPGYQPARSVRVKVESGETLSGVELVLLRSGTVTGQVTDADTGKPIQGAWVLAAEWRAAALAESVGATTDADGRYTLRSVPGRRTSLRVRATGYHSLLAGGVECDPGREMVRDFALTPVARGKRAGNQLTGIGAVLKGQKDGVLIRELIQGGPAAEVLMAGDVVVMVDDLEVAGASLKEVAQAIRGEVDTDVVLWVKRAGEAEPVRVVITRKRVQYP